MTIPERIAEIGAEMAKGSHSPAQAQVQLAGLLSSINGVVTDFEIAYKRKLVELRKEYKSVAETELFGEATEEYAEWRRYLSAKDSCEHMLKALSNASYSMNAEARLQR